jgi:hypothetical protein
MPVCPSCNQLTADSDAMFCAHCGFALPSGRAGGEGSPALAGAHVPSSGPLWPASARVPAANPMVVAVGLGALATAVVVAVALSYGSGSGAGDHAVGGLATRSPLTTRATGTKPRQDTATTNAAASRGPRAHGGVRYRGGGYSFVYPRGWRVARGDRPLPGYRETVIESADGSARVTVDYSPGETIAPAAKAAAVEAALQARATPGYRRISFGPTTISGRAAFGWDFTVADANPRRADLFLSATTGGFALLADGRDFARARSTARLIASSVSSTG